MNKFLILISLILILFACDRFEHEIYQNAEIEAMFGEFTNAIETANIDEIMTFYNENYLNDAFSKSDFEVIFINYISEYDSLTASLDNYYSDFSINWTLSCVPTDSTNSEKIISFHDIIDSDHYKFIGNQINPPAYDPLKPMILVQSSTAQSCGNCPATANKLAEMKREYGGQLVYLDYVSDGPNPTEIFYPFAMYYEIYTQPTVVFQGEDIVTGSLADELNSYSTYCEEIVNSEKIIQLNLSDISCENTILGTIIIDGFETLPLDNLKLEMAVIEKYSEYEYHINGQELHNVVVAVKSQDLTSAEIDFTIDYEIENFENTMLVVWVQTKEEPYNSATCKIYDAQVYDFEN